MSVGFQTSPNHQSFAGSFPSAALSLTNSFANSNTFYPGYQSENGRLQQNIKDCSVEKPKTKLKRVRQRVDAGEPRNTYSSIFCFSSPGRGGQSSNAEESTSPVAESLGEEESFKGSLDCSSSEKNDSAEMSITSENQLNRTISDADGTQMQKKARVENIINYIQSVSPCVSASMSSSGNSPEPQAGSQTISQQTTSRRKRYQPQQLETRGQVDSFYDEEEEDCEDMIDDDTDEIELNERKVQASQADSSTVQNESPKQTICADIDKRNLKDMQNELLIMQRRYIETLTEHQRLAFLKNEFTMDDGKRRDGLELLLSAKEIQTLADRFKSQLMSTMTSCIDKAVENFLQSLRSASVMPIAMNLRSRQAASAELSNGSIAAPRNGLFFNEPHLRPFYCGPFGYSNPLAPGSFPLGPTLNAPGCFPPRHTDASSIYPAFQGCFNFHPMATSLQGGDSAKPTTTIGVAEPATAFSGLVMPRKRRSKVTDTRVNRVTPGRSDESQNEYRQTGNFLAGGYPPSMVAVAGGFGYDEAEFEPNSPSQSEGTEAEVTHGTEIPQAQNTTLTPMHLRKAKLMFFYTRYPSSVLLKAFFPDIRFNKNNTAQLVKWFSNFRCFSTPTSVIVRRPLALKRPAMIVHYRHCALLGRLLREFYYIQMEKYARQAVSEGARSEADITVTVDSELYKVLNLHYNRNNHVQAPASFRRVVEATLHEFFNAVLSGRDAEPSWKKSIYKVIARMDDQIPEYFKSPNFLEQLE
ncbi:Homeobox protein prospero [Trichinella papuae]|uniref:Homeobox protein prospero n=1 Tax=Trichinella papuae TaxID=268474 RepID=A0A0V1MF81_9BILA|nr:Homeobox protein prospero [Trichinella papuae]